MTTLNKDVVRITPVPVDAGREAVITLRPPNLIGFRLKGTRKTYWTTVEACYKNAVWTEVAASPRRRVRRGLL